MYLGSNKQNQIRYHGRVGMDNHTMGAISPNGQIMPDFSVAAKPAPSASASSSSVDFSKFFKGVGKVATTALKAQLDYKIQIFNLKQQQAYLKQQQAISDAQSFQSFARQNPVATQGVDYGTPPPMAVRNDAPMFSGNMGKYLPYLAGGAALLLILIVSKRG